jgi:REP element-mobilizing transposase RayT
MNNKFSYHPAVHHRRSIRLAGYDYSQEGAYFVTICTYQRVCLFGQIVDGKMRLNEFGQIALEQWRRLPERFESIEMNAFVVMPNHIHGIMVITDPDPVGAGLTPAPEIIAQPHSGQPQGLPLRVTLGNIVGGYKSLVANECLKIYKTKNETMGKLWQRNYYEHIIRDEKSYEAISAYIANNPSLWEQDSLFIG